MDEKTAQEFFIKAVADVASNPYERIKELEVNLNALQTKYEELVDDYQELEADITIRDRALVRRNNEIARLMDYCISINEYPEQVTRILLDWCKADKEEEQ
jgi:TolA-binding protein